MAMQNTNTNAPTGPATALWRIVVAEYEQAHTQFECNWAAYEAAEKAAEAESPTRHDFRETYGLRVGMTREDALIAVDRRIDRRERLDAGQGDFPDAKVVGMATEAERIVDEFFAYVAAHSAAHDRHRVEELRRQHQDFVGEVFDPAREKLLATPAPDATALAFKAEILAKMYDEAEGLRDDCKRLFAECA